jgi:hypothetical protein
MPRSSALSTPLRLPAIEPDNRNRSLRGTVPNLAAGFARRRTGGIVWAAELQASASVCAAAPTDNTLGIMPRSLRSLARQAVKGVAWGRPGTSCAVLRSAPEVHKPRRRYLKRDLRSLDEPCRCEEAVFESAVLSLAECRTRRWRWAQVRSAIAHPASRLVGTNPPALDSAKP